MGARILIQSGVGAGTCHPINRNVLRIGNGPDMDLTLPYEELASHTLTLEYREGGYTVHNRTNAAINLGGRTLHPKAADRWFDTDLLTLPGEIQLAIEFDEDPSPATKPSVHASTRHSSTDSPPSEVGSPRVSQVRPTISSGPSVIDSKSSPVKSSSTWMQIVVIALCVAAVGILLTRDRMMRHRGVGGQLPSFDQLVEKARQHESVGDTPSQGPLLQQLQFAEAAMVRGNASAARQRYSHVRAKLLPRASGIAPDADDPAKASLHEEMFRWVEWRLSQL